MKLFKLLSVFAIAASLLVGAGLAQAEVAILDNLSQEGIQAVTIDDNSLNQERAKASIYLNTRIGGSYNFYRTPPYWASQLTLELKKPEMIVTGIASQSGSGYTDTYYDARTNTQLWTHNLSTGAISTTSHWGGGPIIHWDGYTKGGFGGVRNWGEVRSIARTNGAGNVRSINLYGNPPMR